MDIENDLDNGLGLGIGLGIGIAAVIVGYYFYKKSTAVKTTSKLGNNEEVRIALGSFVNDIIQDYYNEYRFNFLAGRFNITELEREKSYVFETKRIGSLVNIVGFNKVSIGEEYLGEIIIEKYNVVIHADDQLSFITEMSRIEGKIKAVESVKAQLPKEDYNKLIGELEEDLNYYKEKYSPAGLKVE